MKTYWISLALLTSLNSFTPTPLSYAYFSQIALPEGDFFGGGTYRFRSSGVTGPYSIHYSFKIVGDSVEAVIDNSFSSSGSFRILLVPDPNLILEIRDPESRKIGEGYCIRSTCRLEFKVDTIMVSGQPVQAIFEMTTFYDEDRLTTVGSVGYGAGPKIISFHENLIRK